MNAPLRFVAYQSTIWPRGVIGLLSADNESLTPLLFPDFRPVSTLHHLIEQWDEVSDRLLPGTPVEQMSAVKLLAPLRGRDVIGVGYNYKAHHEEFVNTGYDKSLRPEEPSHPIIFTKRATSIIPSGAQIYPHPKVTQKLDYEGELGIIIGKGGIGIRKEDAWKHVWGAVIINDVTARERQRDHKQFYIGKSLDTFCPMGPYAVHSSCLDFTKLNLETKVNGIVRQSQNTSELIFDVPTLIETCSMGITLQPGDVIATGTPEGVAASRNEFLKSGDEVAIAITGLGVLRNTISNGEEPPKACVSLASLRGGLASGFAPGANMLELPSATLHYSIAGVKDGSAHTVVFVHGLGGSLTNWEPLIQAAQLDKTYRVITFDLEGHGLSQMQGEAVSIEAYANTLAELLTTLEVTKAVIVGHSMGCLIANTFASKNPDKVERLVLVAPVRQMPDPAVAALSARAENVRQNGMSAIATTIATAGTSPTSTARDPLIKGYVTGSLLATPAEGYAQACLALARAQDPDYTVIRCPVLIIAATEDKTSPTGVIEAVSSRLTTARVVTIPDAGHWVLVERVPEVAEAVLKFLRA